MQRSKRSAQFRQIILAIFFAVLGFLINPVIENQTDDLITSENLTIILFIVFGLFTFISAILWSFAYLETSNIGYDLEKISQKIGKDAQLVPYKEAYIKLIQWMEDVEEEVVVLTFTNPGKHWTEDKESPRRKSPERKAWFKAAERVIKSDNISYKRILQLDLDKDTGRPDITEEELMSGYQYLRQEELNHIQSKLLCEISNRNSEKAQLFFSRIYFQNTFVLVDKKKLFMNFHVLNPETGKIDSPFVLIAEDSSGQKFEELRRAYNNVINRSISIFDCSKFSDSD